MARHAFTPPCGFDLAATTIVDLEDVIGITFWGYRIVAHPDGTYFVHEAYYGDDGNLLGFSVSPSRPCGDSLDEVGSELGWMAEALDEPTLRYADFRELSGQFTRYGWEGNGAQDPGGPRGAADQETD